MLGGTWKQPKTPVISHYLLLGHLKSIPSFSVCANEWRFLCSGVETTASRLSSLRWGEHHYWGEALILMAHNAFLAGQNSSYHVHVLNADSITQVKVKAVWPGTSTPHHTWEELRNSKGAQLEAERECEMGKTTEPKTKGLERTKTHKHRLGGGRADLSEHTDENSILIKITYIYFYLHIVVFNIKKQKQFTIFVSPYNLSTISLITWIHYKHNCICISHHI